MLLRRSERLARMGRRRRRVAFVLSGGGPLGALQVGFLQALFEEGVTPDLVVGSSVGALNAAFIASNPTLGGAEDLRRVWLKWRRDDLFPGGRLASALNVVKRGSHVFSNAGIRRLIENELPAATFGQLAIPAHIVATSLESGEETWFSTGPLADSLLASAAMPGVFPPVEIDGVRYIDGGVANNVPASRAVQLGAARVYVLNVDSTRQRRQLVRPHDFMMHGMVLARAQRYRRDIESLRRQATIVEFPTVEVGHVPFTDLSRTERLIDAGLEAGLAFLRRSGGPAEGDAAPEHHRTG